MQFNNYDIFTQYKKVLFIDYNKHMINYVNEI
jgi:hypothetical protein